MVGYPRRCVISLQINTGKHECIPISTDYINWWVKVPLPECKLTSQTTFDDSQRSFSKLKLKNICSQLYENFNECWEYCTSFILMFSQDIVIDMDVMLWH